MKLYEITIKPTSGFGTPLKGDTIFGHFCWQVAEDSSLVEGGIENLINLYDKKPFVIFSSAFPKLVNSKTNYILKKPDLPVYFYIPHSIQQKSEKILLAKEHKKKKWMIVDESLKIDISKTRFLTDKEVTDEISRLSTPQTKKQMRWLPQIGFKTSFLQPHNTINRLTQTTGTREFSPYIQEACFFYPETELVIFALIDESFTSIENVCEALRRIGQWGYGKDASIGLGKFSLAEWEELRIPEIKAEENSLVFLYSLAPAIPQKDAFSRIYFRPFIRFGKHGSVLACSRNPFKNPVIMADEGAVFVPEDIASIFKKPYIGKCAKDLSKIKPETVIQGYSPCLPLIIGEIS